MLLRHRRSVDSLMAINLPRMLDAMAKDLVLQARWVHAHTKQMPADIALVQTEDLDECFMLQRCVANPYGNLRPRRVDFTLQATLVQHRFRALGFAKLRSFLIAGCGLLCDTVGWVDGRGTTAALWVCLAFVGWILGLLSRRWKPQWWTLSERIALSDPESLNSNSMKVCGGSCHAFCRNGRFSSRRRDASAASCRTGLFRLHGKTDGSTTFQNSDPAAEDGYAWLFMMCSKRMHSDFDLCLGLNRCPSLHALSTEQ